MTEEEHEAFTRHAGYGVFIRAMQDMLANAKNKLTALAVDDKERTDAAYRSEVHAAAVEARTLERVLALPAQLVRHEAVVPHARQGDRTGY